ncbi:hypothetical protein TRIUR3_30142 [Triticum urartu]|uniref:Uncharacterized protein n=1 Tax=Triticum urartu TaxID=4572 RepID=M7YVU9_TRIUA|nr:hypothetical protein TRIUR3_30142 [Triticum urartu]
MARAVGAFFLAFVAPPLMTKGEVDMAYVSEPLLLVVGFPMAVIQICGYEIWIEGREKGGELGTCIGESALMGIFSRSIEPHVFIQGRHFLGGTRRWWGTLGGGAGEKARGPLRRGTERHRWWRFWRPISPAAHDIGRVRVGSDQIGRVRVGRERKGEKMNNVDILG